MKQIQAVVDGVLVRLFTLLSAALAGYGMSEHHISILIPALTVIAGIGVDMATGLVIKRLGR